MATRLPRFLVVLGLLLVGFHVRAGDDIPFVASLDGARIAVTSLASGQRDSLMLGNGDLYGIVWERDGVLTMRVTKNDIWDASVDTSRDDPLPEVDIRNNTVTGSTGVPPSYNKPYPQPRCAAAIRLGAERSTNAVKSAVLDLRRAVATVGQSEPTKIRILADRNVVLIQTSEPVDLEAIVADSLPAAVSGTTGHIAWLRQQLPPDANGDWSGMEFAIAVAAKGNVKAVPLVSSYDIEQGTVLEHAIALAGDAVREKETKLVVEHEKMWQGHAHGTFMGEMIGIAGLINEFLMQSVGNTIRVFPCWPDDKDARFANLRAQGGFLVSARRSSGEVLQVNIISRVGGTLRLLSPWPTITVRRGAEIPETIRPSAMGVVTLATWPNEVLLFTKE